MRLAARNQWFLPRCKVEAVGGGKELQPVESSQSADRATKSFQDSARVLWLAGRMPSEIGPDHLTALGFLSQDMVGVC
jgi:hypothetical protein